jgi:hypothetical protein
MREVALYSALMFKRRTARPNHDSTAEAPWPYSARVGTSGKSFSRDDAAVASGRNWPCAICGSACTEEVKVVSSRPLITSIMICGPLPAGCPQMMVTGFDGQDCASTL